MHIGYTEEQEALRQELRAYYAELLTPEVEERAGARGNGVGPGHPRDRAQQMGEDGWLGIGWPKEYGGQGRSADRAVHLLRRVDAGRRAGADAHDQHRRPDDHALRHRRAEGRSSCRRSSRARSTSAIGYTEPGAGTDLASLKTRAVRDGDEYVINGQKIFTSLASDADYVWLAARTDPEAQEAQGHLDVHRADGHARASRSSRCSCMSEHDINTDVLRGRAGAGRQPRRRREQRLDASSPTSSTTSGSRCARRASSSGSSTTSAAGPSRRSWPTAAGSIDQEWVQVNLARVHAKLEFLRLINWKVAWTADARATLNLADASAIKVFGTEFYLEAFRLLMEIIGQPAYLKAGLARGACCGAGSSGCYRSLLILTFGGGTNEVQRDLIAMFGLGMPRSPVAGGGRRWTSRSPRSRRRSGTWPGRSSRTSVTPERLSELEARRRPVRPRDRGPSWPRPACSASPCPRTLGGGGLGLLEAVPRARGGGPHAAPVPVPRRPSSSAPCRSPSFGTDEQRHGLLPAVAAGDDDPHRRARRAGDAAGGPDHDGQAGRRRLAPRRREDLRPGGHRRPTSSWCRPHRRRRRRVPRRPRRTGRRPSSARTPRAASPRPASTLDGVASAADGALGDAGDGARIVDWIVQRATVGLCATTAGVCEQALELTAEYTKNREQFDRPDRHVPGRRPARRRRLHRHRGHPAHDVAGGVAAGRGPAGRRRGRRRQVLGGRGRPAGRRTPPSTCTAASASTATTRSTATSSGPSSSSSRSAAPPPRCCASARCSPRSPTRVHAPRSNDGEGRACSGSRARKRRSSTSRRRPPTCRSRGPWSSTPRRDGRLLVRRGPPAARRAPAPAASVPAAPRRGAPSPPPTRCGSRTPTSTSTPTSSGWRCLRRRPGRAGRPLAGDAASPLDRAGRCGT